MSIWVQKFLLGILIAMAGIAIFCAIVIVGAKYSTGIPDNVVSCKSMSTGNTITSTPGHWSYSTSIKTWRNFSSGTEETFTSREGDVCSVR
jgi:hypothetical protein